MAEPWTQAWSFGSYLIALKSWLKKQKVSDNRILAVFSHQILSFFIRISPHGERYVPWIAQLCRWCASICSTLAPAATSQSNVRQDTNIPGEKLVANPSWSWAQVRVRTAANCGRVLHFIMKFLILPPSLQSQHAIFTTDTATVSHSSPYLSLKTPFWTAVKSLVKRQQPSW